MRKKILSFIFILALILPCSLLLVACKENMVNVYTINFYDDNGMLLLSKVYQEGETIAIPNDPTKLDDDNYSYTFAGWDKNIDQKANASADYYATYIKESKHFDLEILNNHECLIKPKASVTALPETVVIPETLYDLQTQKYYNVITMDEEIFNYHLNINVKNIYLPKTIKILNGEYTNYSSKLSNVYYDGMTREWCSINIGIPENPFKEAEHFFFKNEITGEYQEVKNLVIPEDVVNIGAYQFEGFDCLESVEFECDQLKFIGDNAFSDCDNLKKIYFAQKSIWNNWIDIVFDGNTVGNFSTPFSNDIEHVYAFNNQTNQYEEMTNVEISINKNIGYGQFSGCKFIDSIKIGGEINDYSGYVTIGASAFNHIGSVSLLHIGANVVGYEQLAFQDVYAKTLILDSEYLLNDMLTYHTTGTEVIYVNSNIFNEDIKGFTKQASSDKEGYVKYIKNA